MQKWQVGATNVAKRFGYLCCKFDANDSRIQRHGYLGNGKSALQISEILQADKGV